MGLALIYFQVKNLSEQERIQVGQAISHAHWFWIILAMLTAVISHIFRAQRWAQIINTTGEDVPTLHTFYGVMIGYLVNGFVPRAGEIARCGIITRTDHVRFEKLVGTVVAERIFDLIVLLLVVVLTLLSQFQFLYQLINEKLFSPFFQTFQNKFDDLLVLILLFLALSSFIVISSAIIMKRLNIGNRIIRQWEKIRHNFVDGFTSILNIKNKWAFVGYSLAMWVCYFFMAFLIFKALPESKHLGFDAGLSVLTSGSLALVIPTPGGLGSYHQFVSNTLQLYGISPVIGVSLSWLIWSANFAVMLILGLFSFILVSLKK